MLEIVEARTLPARIKVFGIGGGGSNAVSRMIQAGLSGVEFWIANTDVQALETSECPNRLQVGNAVTRGLGAGGDPEIGRMAAEEDRSSIAEAIRGADMLFVTAGMGGGTGTGGAPVVAEVARESGVLTVAVVTKPFGFEGKKKIARAEAGLAELGRNVDTLIVIPNEKLLNIVEPGTPFRQAMLVADEVLLQATRGISDLVTGHGEINLDFADVKSVMRNRGNALLGCGIAAGKDRAVEAAQAAVSSPLLDEVNIFGAEALIINVQGGGEMSLHEAAEAAQFISERVGEEADVYWGAVIDPNLGEEMRVTVIATGFAGGSPGTRPSQETSTIKRAPSVAREAMVEAASTVAFAAPRAGANGAVEGRTNLEPETAPRGAEGPGRTGVACEEEIDEEAPPADHRRTGAFPPAGTVETQAAGPGEEELAESETTAGFARYAESSFRAAEPESQGSPPDDRSPEDGDPAGTSRRWPIQRDAGSDLFVEVEGRARSVKGGRAQGRSTWTSLHENTPDERGLERGGGRRDEAGLSSRLRRRHPLDEPTFMRLKMD